jgi:hypothetical protein
MNDILTVLHFHAFNKDFIRFLSTTTYYHVQKNRFEYKEMVLQTKIDTLWYKKCFTSILLESEFSELKPKKITLSLFYKPLYTGCIPSSVTKLDLGFYYGVLRVGIIPNSIKKLKFGQSYRHILYPGEIPNSVENLYFPGDSMARIGAIPNSVHTLHYGCEYHTCLFPGCIPKSVKKLSFHKKFRQSLWFNDIPDSVEILEFGENYEKSIIPKIIPESVKKIRFGINCNAGLHWEDIFPTSPGVIWEIIISTPPKKEPKIPPGVIWTYIHAQDIA